MFNFIKNRDYQTYQVINWRTLTVIFLLILGVSLFYAQTQLSETDNNKKIIQDLLELRQYSARVNEQLLLAQQHHFHNYDRLTNSAAKLTPLLQQIITHISSLKPTDKTEEMFAITVTLDGQLRQQADLLEEFKSKNALLKNSLHFIPTIANSILIKLNQEWANSELIHAINQLIREILGYNLTGDKRLLPQLNHRLQTFERDYMGSAMQNNHSLRRLLAHIQIVLKTHHLVNKISDNLLMLDIISESIDLENIYLDHYEDALSQTKTARLVIYLFSLMLLIYVIWLFRRMLEQSTTLRIALIAQKRTEEALFLEKEIAHFTLQSIGGGVIRTNLHGDIEFINSVANSLTGINRQEAIGKSLSQVFSVMLEDSGQCETNLVTMSLARKETLNFPDTYSLFSQDGQHYPIRLTIAPICDRKKQPIGVVLAFYNVSEERLLRQRLIHQANHDALTGLINRREFEKRVEKVITQTRIQKAQHALLFMDLDQFKIVNDTCGHIAGDALLKMLSQRLQLQLSEQDTLARLGGDEFGVLLLNSSEQNSLRIAQVLLQAVSDFSFEWNGQAHKVGVSIGVNMINENSAGLYEVMSGADMACYAAKDGGRNRVHIYEFDDAQTSRYQDEMEWVAKTRNSIKNEHLILYCQAIERADKSACSRSHFEVLLRMQDEDGSIISPDSFMRSAERFGIMSEIDRWVVEHAFIQYSHYFSDWDADKAPELAINLSGTSFSDLDFSDFVIGLFETYQVPAKNICFEVTETAAIINLAQAKIFMNHFSSKGCKFSLDDFGTGLSSFGYLKNLSVDYLKIDGGFVKDLITDPIDQATVSAINQVGHTLGLKTIAEWVENQEIQDRLVEMGVDFLQGYHLHRPEPMKDVFDRYLASSASKKAQS